MKITNAISNFVREPLLSPFGFKGGYLSELWQVVVRLDAGEYSGVGTGIQSVLWSDASVFSSTSQAGGNSYMFAMTDYALRLARGMEFTTPFDLLDALLPKVYEYGKVITGNPDLRKTFALNALVPVDNAAWQLYSKIHNETDFLKLVPQDYQAPLQGKQEKLCSIPLVTYGMSIDDVKKLIADGYFFLKVKIGSDPDKDGDREKMLAWDKNRLKEIHEAVKDMTTPYTQSGHIPYYLDANGRYDSKERLAALLDYAKEIGALERIAIVEEPFPEELLVDVSDLPARIAADESAHSDEDAIERIGLGYTAIALKPIAKTMSMSLKILAEAHKRNIPCFCADLTVNPWMVDFNKNVAARIAPLPGMKIGVLESNGPQNYTDWDKMRTYHPLFGKVSYIDPVKGIYTLGEEFYQTSGGIFCDSPYYSQVVK